MKVPKCARQIKGFALYFTNIIFSFRAGEGHTMGLVSKSNCKQPKT